jgi:glycerol dehydrogenase
MRSTTGSPPVPATHGLAHGQKVNVGSVTQLVLEGAPVGELRDFVEFTTRVGVPTTLTEVGLRADDVDSLKRVADAATVEDETIHAMPFEVRSDDVVSALASIERFAKRVRREPTSRTRCRTQLRPLPDPSDPGHAGRP